jgi:primosomal protein N' (replication factor Y)
MWVQTWHPQHPLYKALQRHDFAAFAQSQLADRRAAGLPPYSHLALLRAESRDPAVALAWLKAAAEAAAALPGAADVTIYPPVPPPVAKVAGIERLQMLVESASRTHLQRLLADWMPALHALRSQHKGLARWAIDVDPLGI